MRLVSFVITLFLVPMVWAEDAIEPVNGLADEQTKLEAEEKLVGSLPYNPDVFLDLSPILPSGEALKIPTEKRDKK